MKKYITVAALLAAGSAFANADVVTIAEGFFGSEGSTSATFKGGQWGKPFNGIWTADSDASGGVFGAGTTDFSVVYQYGIRGGDAAAAWSAGTLYYGTANNNSVADGNQPSLTVSDGSASITNIQYTTGQGATVAVIQNRIFAADLQSVTDLSLSFTVGGNAVDLAVFYLADGGGENDVKRLGLWDYSSEGKQSLKLDYSEIDASKNGTFVVAVRLDGVEAWSGAGSVSDLTWSGTAAIPEPSAFGLLAGLGALALVASRRRRK